MQIKVGKVPSRICIWSWTLCQGNQELSNLQKGNVLVKHFSKNISTQRLKQTNQKSGWQLTSPPRRPEP